MAALRQLIRLSGGLARARTSTPPLGLSSGGLACARAAPPRPLLPPVHGFRRTFTGKAQADGGAPHQQMREHYPHIPDSRAALYKKEDFMPIHPRVFRMFMATTWLLGVVFPLSAALYLYPQFKGSHF
ncbi:hypothetical protein ACP70R_023176 [Stipagrostis hirtigluma subsp. patula]